MLDRSKISLFSLILLFLISACGTVSQTGDVSAAVSAGIIASPDGDIVLRDDEFVLYEVYKGNLERNMDLYVSANFTVMHRLSFEAGGGAYSGSFVDSVGTRVYAGEILAEQIFPDYMHEPLEISRYRVAFEIEQFETRFANEHRDRNRELSEARVAFAQADANERGNLRLQVRRLEVLLDRFLVESENTRQSYQQQLDNIYLPGQRIYAPYDGVVTFITTIREESIVDAGTLFFIVAKEDSVVFTAEAPVDVLRHGNVLNIVNDELTFEVAVVSDPHAAATSHSHTMSFTLLPTNQDALIADMEAAGISWHEITNMSFSAEVDEIMVYDTIVLPVRALRQESGSEYVLIYDEGQLQKRYVVRGLLALPYVQILTGLEEGQKVVMP